MVRNERQAIFSLASIMACRMLGLFMILPVFSLYASKLPHATPLLIGIALGVYGLTQACLQIPFGHLSDRVGRKKVITYGLILFALGSLIAALSHSIYGIIAGRALQGAGAIGSTLLATASDLTRDENRSKAMATIGLSIGLSFSLAMILGPIINHLFHLNGIFWTTFLLALLCLVLLHTVVPKPPKLLSSAAVEFQSQQFFTVIKNKALLRLNLGIFSMHAMLTATFIATPILLAHGIQLSQLQQTVLYLVVLVLAFVFMLPFIIVAEKKRKMKLVFISAIALLILCELSLALFSTSFAMVGITLLFFFTAFSLLEASLPSLVSKIAPIQRKGTAMGIYSTAQFFGIFIGGLCGGLLYTHFPLYSLFLFCAIIGVIWIFFAASMPQPPYLSTYIFELSKLAPLNKIQADLSKLNGVNEVAIMPDEGLIYIKADNKIINKEQLRKEVDKSNLHQQP